jgi:hypothetical protein
MVEKFLIPKVLNMVALGSLRSREFTTIAPSIGRLTCNKTHIKNGLLLCRSKSRPEESWDNLGSNWDSLVLSQEVKGGAVRWEPSGP